MHPRVSCYLFADSFSPVWRIIDRPLQTAEATPIIPQMDVFQNQKCGYIEKNTRQVRLMVMAKLKSGE